MKMKLFFIITCVSLMYLNLNMKLVNNKHEVLYDAPNAIPFSQLVDPEKSPANCDNRRGLNVVINQGEVAYLDESTNIDHLTIFGELHCDPKRAGDITELKVKSIHVHGVFQCGTNLSPYKKKLIISMKHDPIDVRSNDSYRGIMVMNGGKLNLNGDTKNSGWLKLNQTTYPGDQHIVVDNGSVLNQIQRKDGFHSLTNTLKWSVGDEIAIAPTGFNYLEAENFKITGFDANNPNKIYLNRPIQFQHWGEKEYFHPDNKKTIVLDERAEVANLTRSILIRADETNAPIDESNTPAGQLGGHMMVMFGGQAFINSIELYKMGQAGIMARYPFHWHYVGNAPGQYIKNSSIHHSYQRCVTVHRTHQTLVENNVCYNFKGHGYFFEDGNEIQNQMIKNLAILAKAPTSTKLLLASDNILQSESQGRFPSVSSFWISNPNNIIRHNIAAGSVGTGFWMSFENEVKNGAGVVVATPLDTATAEFNYNTAHSNKVGITWDGAATGNLTNNPNNPNDRIIQSAHYSPPQIPIFIGLKAYKNLLSGIYFRGDSAIYKNTLVADNGWSFWVAYNQIIRDSTFIGATANTNPNNEYFFYNNATIGRFRKPGIVLYDGPFEVHNSSFLNYDTQPKTIYYNTQPYNVTTAPFTSTGGTNKFINLASQLTFTPEPMYRAVLENPTRVHDRQYLANAIIRDLDGSLTGVGHSSVLVAKRSLGITPESGCSDAAPNLMNFKVCPSSYTEGSQTFMRWGWGPWGTPFIVKRSDGALNYPKEEWNGIQGSPNNLFATANSSNYSYEILPSFQYENDKGFWSKTAMDANSEILNPIQPVIKITAYGKNCKLHDGAQQVASLAMLKNQTTTSYYSSDEEFYVKLVPKNWWEFITQNPLTQATAMTTMHTRHGISCDVGYLPKKVKGKIERVLKTVNTTEVSGWACNFTHQTPIKVKLYAYGPILPISNSPAKAARRTINGYTFIREITSNLSSPATQAFHCGRMANPSYNFNFSISNLELDKFNSHTFYVQGVSNTGGQNIYLEDSGRFSVKHKFQFDPLEMIKTKNQL